LASGPAENFASRELPGNGPAIFPAGFKPTTATFTFAEHARGIDRWRVLQ
jgi:hypothetical protein